MHISTRALYLLALFQLVAGPLVLVAVTTFCRLTVREMPESGVAVAVSHAWKSSEFQSLLLPFQNDPAATTDSAPSKPEPKVKKDGAKFSLIAWQQVPSVLIAPMKAMQRASYAKCWTPAWSQAPPGPPPRVA